LRIIRGTVLNSFTEGNEHRAVNKFLDLDEKRKKTFEFESLDEKLRPLDNKINGPWAWPELTGS
jgi:hypothetical protein